MLYEFEAATIQIGLDLGFMDFYGGKPGKRDQTLYQGFYWWIETAKK